MFKRELPKETNKQMKTLLTGEVKELKDVQILTTGEYILIKYDVEIEGEVTKIKFNPNFLSDWTNGIMSVEDVYYNMIIALAPESLKMLNTNKIHGLLIDDTIYKLNGKIIVSNIRINDVKIEGEAFKEFQDKIEEELNDYYIIKKRLRIR